MISDSAPPRDPSVEPLPRPAVSRPTPTDAGFEPDVPLHPLFTRPATRRAVDPPRAGAAPERRAEASVAAEQIPAREAASPRDDAWLRVLDDGYEPAVPAAAAEPGEAARPAHQEPAEEGGGAADPTAAPDPHSDAEEIAVRLERAAARIRGGADVEEWIRSAEADPLERLVAGVVLGYLRGREAARAGTEGG